MIRIYRVFILAIEDQKCRENASQSSVKLDGDSARPFYAADGGQLMSRFGKHLLYFMLLHAACCTYIYAQPNTVVDKQLALKAERLEKLIYERPRRGTTFDLWFQHHSDSGDLKELIARVEKRASNNETQFAPQIVRGLLLERTGRHAGAMEAYRDAVKLDDGYYSRFLLGRLLTQQKDFDEAREQLEQAFAYDIPKREYLAVAKLLTNAYLRSDEIEKAQQTWRKTAERFRDDARVLSELATMLSRERQFDESIKLWQQVRTLAKDDLFLKLDADLNLVQIQIDRGESEQAIESLGKLLDRVAPESWRADDIRSRLERAILASSGPSELLAFWKQRAKSHPDELQTMTSLARAYEYVGESADALVTYERAVERAPNRRDIREMLITHLTRAGKFSLAVEHAKYLAERHTADTAILLRLGELYLRLPDSDTQSLQRRAIKTWSQIASIRPNDPTYAVEAAKACAASVGRTLGANAESSAAPVEPTNELSNDIKDFNQLFIEAAERHYREAIRRAPDAPQYYEYLGEFLHWSGRPQAARQEWARISKPDTAEAWHLLSRIYSRFGHSEDAIAAGRKSIERAPQDLSYRKDQIELYLQGKRFGEAVADTKELLQQIASAPNLDERWEESTIKLLVEAITASDSADDGNTLKDKEIQLLRKNVEVDPNDYRSLWTLALLAELDQVLKYFEQAIAARPDHRNLTTAYADALVHAKKGNLAVQQLRRLLTIAPAQQRQTYRRIVELRLRQKNYSDAKKNVEQLIQVAPSDPESYVLKALVARNAGKGEEEVEALRQAIRIDPDNFFLRRQLVHAFTTIGRTQEARKEAFLCLEMAKTLVDKKSALDWLLRYSASSKKEKNEIVAKIKYMRQRDSDPHELTLCLVQALKNFNRRVEALMELEGAYRQRPNDTALLKQIVTTSEQMKKPNVAVDYQERLVLIDKSPESNERLARLYRQTNRLEDANRIWDSLFERDLSEAEILAMIDRQAEKNQDFYQAQRLVEVGQSRFPESWRLAYNAALLHMALNQPSQAVRSFETVLGFKIEAVSGKTSTSQLMLDMPPEFEQLVSITNARGTFARLQTYSNRYGSVGSRYRKYLFRPPYKLTGNGDNLATARIYSVIGLLQNLADDEKSAWIEKALLPTSDPENTRLALLACWCSVRTDYLSRLIEHAAKRDPADTTPHLLRVIASIESESDEKIVQSFRQLRNMDSDIAKVLRDVYLKRVVATKGIDLAEIANEELGCVTHFRELPALLPLVDDQDESLRASLIAKAQQLLRDSQAGTIDVDDLAAVLPQVVQASEVERDANLVLEFFDYYLRRAKFDKNATEQNKRRLSINNGMLRLLAQQRNAVQVELAFRRLQNKNRTSAQAARDKARIRLLRSQASSQLMVTNLRVRRFGVQPSVVRLPQRKREDSARLIRSGEFGFPSSTAILNRSRLRFFDTLVSNFEKSGKLELLNGWLEERCREDQDPDVATFQLALAYATWWSGDKDRTTSMLRQLVREHDDPSLKLALVRCCLETNRLREALDSLNEVEMDSKNATEITMLRNSIAHFWSKFAFRRDFMGHAGSIPTLAFNHDGTRLVSGGIDRTVRLWDVASGEQLAQYDAPDMVLAVAFSPDGKQVASAGYDGAVTILDSETLESSEVLRDRQGIVRSLAYSPDGKKLASAGDDQSVMLWNMHDKRLIGKLSGHINTVLSLDFSHDGNSLASGSADQTVLIWDTETGGLQKLLGVNAGPIRGLCFFNLSNRLATGCEGRQLAIWKPLDRNWNARDSKWKKLELIPDSAIRCLAISPDDKLLAMGFHDHSVQIWDAQAKTEQVVLHGHQGRLNAMTFSPKGKYLASSSFDGSLKLWLTDPLANFKKATVSESGDVEAKP